MSETLMICRVCGAAQDDYPWGKDGKTPSFDICSCCGTEFGYEDATLNAILRKRKLWIDSGGKWLRPEHMPKDWDLEESLRTIPIEFK
jgi:hypothetical protein